MFGVVFSHHFSLVAAAVAVADWARVSLQAEPPLLHVRLMALYTVCMRAFRLQGTKMIANQQTNAAKKGQWALEVDGSAPSVIQVSSCMRH